MTDAKDIIDLDMCVINALNLFAQTGVPHLETITFARPLVVGSGNAAVTGRIIFADKDAVFADESNYMEKLAVLSAIDGAIILSASGAKHAPLIAADLKKRNLPSILITNTENSPASKIVDKTYVLKKNPEPYTYNTSTYLSMILAKTGEKPDMILQMIEDIKKTIPTNLSAYHAYYIILPNHFESLREMFVTKFDELFGPMITGRVYTIDETKHAKTLVPSDTELFIGLGYDNTSFGKNRWNISLPETASYASTLAVGYYVIGQIQKSQPQYFKENLDAYIKQASEIFGEELKAIVE